jgi:hypothetical protein
LKYYQAGSNRDGKQLRLHSTKVIIKVIQKLLSFFMENSSTIALRTALWSNTTIIRTESTSDENIAISAYSSAGLHVHLV